MNIEGKRNVSDSFERKENKNTEKSKRGKLTVALKDCNFPNVASSIVPVQPITPSSILSFISERVGSTDRYSSDLNDWDFHPQDWETEKTSGAEENRVIAVPRADGQEMEK